MRWVALTVRDREAQFANTARAAAVAGVSRRTVLDWISEGKIRFTRIGKKYQVYLPSLLLFLEAQIEP